MAVSIYLNISEITDMKFSIDFKDISFGICNHNILEIQLLNKTFNQYSHQEKNGRFK